ncbi:NEDD8-activating enzyme E1 catalytic subunit [Astathelohania contejeani]|uniref:NEDD8-activating enzyme E1 catalytic subunit n=1 Tax=Astathelohania contejeani TaxID=164912 RepID=A0ABQ7I0N9_9MICR|nr:NEDD8-activating enzyme E1 catalytic subunit [Thelohania contejeani]
MIKILLAGCGGTGTEILKLIVKYKNINLTVIDNDYVEITNLNRQFMFLSEDIGSLKTECITKYLKKYKNIDIEYLSYDVKHLSDLPYDITICALDNMSGRMHLNYLFSNKIGSGDNEIIEPVFVDCGLEGEKAHVKVVRRNTSCLYCIKSLYPTYNTPNICTLSTHTSDRNKLIKSLLLKEKEDNNKPEEYLEKVKRKYNMIAKEKKLEPTSIFELEGIDKEIIPTTSYINSICASLCVYAVAKIIKREEIEFDFIFYDGEKVPYLSIFNLEKDKNCILCNK